MGYCIRIEKMIRWKRCHIVKRRKAFRMIKKEQIIKKSIIYRILICFLCAIMVAGLGEAIHVGIIRHKIKKEGAVCEIEAIPDENIQIERMKDENDEEGAKVTINLSERYLDKLQYAYQTGGEITVKAEIYQKNVYDNYEKKEINDRLLPQLHTSIINIKNNVEKIELYVPDGIELSGLAINNNVKMNKYVCVYIFTFVLLGMICIVFRKILENKVEYLFAIFCMGLGTLIILIQPPQFMSWDEHIHYYNTLGIFQDKGEVLTAAEAYMYLHPEEMSGAPTLSKEEKAMQIDYLNTLNQEVSTQIGNGGYFNYSKIGYIHTAVIEKLAIVMNIPFYDQILIGKFTNLLLYCILLFMTIKVLPIYKRSAMIIGLLPTPMVLATSYSYDVMVIGMIFLATALVIREFYNVNERVKWKNLICIIVMYTLGCCSKAIYIPLILSVIFLPQKKFKNKAQKRVVCAIILTACILLMLSVVLPTTGGEMAADDRGGNTDVAKQLALIFRYPLGYAKILWDNVYRTFCDYILGQASLANMAYMGIHKFATVISVLVFGVIFTEPREIMDKNQKQSLNVYKIVNLILISGVVCLIWTALYLSFTEIGQTIIGGVQGRYYLPMAITGAILLYTDKIQTKFKRTNYNTVILMIILFIWNSSIYSGYLVPYCL